MKTIIVALMSLLMTVTVSGQTAKTVSGHEVWDVIMKSKQANALNGISDPDQIQPGQLLTFKFNDGFDTTYVVEKGDDQWTVVTKMLATMSSVHGPVVKYGDTATHAEPKPEEAGTPLKAVPIPVANENDGTFLGIPWWGWIIIAFALILLYKIVRGEIAREGERRRADAERASNPATAGPAMNPGGITQENAHSIMSEAAHRRFPHSNIRVERIERGTLDSHGVAKEVGYADFPRQMVLNNTPGVRATVFVGDSTEPRYVYSILQCGNDIRMGAGIADDGSITFTPTPDAQPMYTAPVQQTSEQKTEETSGDGDNGVVTLKQMVELLPGVFNKAIEAQTGIDVTFSVAEDGKRDLSIRVLKQGKKDA